MTEKINIPSGLIGSTGFALYEMVTERAPVKWRSTIIMNRNYKDGDKLPLIPPGVLLFEEFMKPYNLGINELARQLQVSPTAISEIVRGKRAISTSMAARLGRFFQNSMQMWLNLQQSYEIEEFERTREPSAIALQVVPFDYVKLEAPMKNAHVSESINMVSYRKRVATKPTLKNKVQVSTRVNAAKKSRKIAAASVGDVGRKQKKATTKSQKERSD